MWSSLFNRFSADHRHFTRGRRRGIDNGYLTSFERLEERRVLATFLVSNMQDSGIGSLRDAVEAANANTADSLHEIVFDAALFTEGRTITLNSPLAITNTASGIRIFGPGRELLTISGDSAHRVLEVEEGARLVLEGVTLAEGWSAESGGGILNAGSLTLRWSAVVNNHADVSGGGIDSSDTGADLWIYQTYFTGNSAGQYGGAAHLRGDNYFSNSRFEENSATWGGAVSLGSSAELELFAIVLRKNEASFGGGLFATGGSATELTIRETLFHENYAAYRGGGMFVSHVNPLEIWGSAFVDNTAERSGAGIETGYVDLSISDSSLLGNRVVQYRGEGGAIRNQSGTLTISRSLIANNHVEQGDGGAIFNDRGELTVLNSTLSGNTAALFGGAIFTLSEHTATVAHTTVYGNRAWENNLDVVDHSAEAGGAIYAWGIDETPPLLLDHALLVGNRSGQGGTVFDQPNELAGNAVDPASRYNLIGHAATAGGLAHGANGNMLGIDGAGTLDPTLVLDTELKHNGGRQATHALLAHSPAVNAGDPNFDPAAYSPPRLHDARGPGNPRIAEGRVDIGALEYTLRERVAAASAGEELAFTIAPAGLPAFLTELAQVPPPMLEPNDPAVEIQLHLTGGEYAGITAHVPHGIRLVIQGDVEIPGASPALVVAEGEVVVMGGVTFTNSTDSPTVVVESGGALTLHGATIHESDAYAQTAILVHAGGTLDLSSNDNTINVRGAGRLIEWRNAETLELSGTRLNRDGLLLSDGFALEDAIHHALDEADLGLVRWAAGEVFVTPASGSIARGIAAATEGDRVHVAAGVYHGDVAVNKSVTLRWAGDTELQGDLTGAGILTSEGSPVTVTIAGRFAPTGTVRLHANAPYAVPGSDFDRYVVSGEVDLREASLEFSGGGASAAGPLVLIENNSASSTLPATAHPQGSIIVLDEATLLLHYDRGDGNDLALSPLRTIRWDGGGDGRSWNDARNWDGEFNDILPGFDDHVVIGPEYAGLTIAYEGSATIGSLHSHAGITATSASLRIQGDAVLSELTLLGTTLSSDGEVRFEGAVYLQGARLAGAGTYYLEGDSTLRHTVYLDADLVNHGLMDFKAILDFSPGVTFTNAAGAEFVSSVDHGTGSVPEVGIGRIVNEGLFRSVGPRYFVAPVFENRAGAVARADGGVLGFLGGGSSAGAFLGAEGSTLHFRDAYEFLDAPGSVLSAYHVHIDNSSVNVAVLEINVPFTARGMINYTGGYATFHNTVDVEGTTLYAHPNFGGLLDFSGAELLSPLRFLDSTASGTIVSDHEVHFEGASILHRVRLAGAGTYYLDGDSTIGHTLYLDADLVNRGLMDFAATLDFSPGFTLTNAAGAEFVSSVNHGTGSVPEVGIGRIVNEGLFRSVGPRYFVAPVFENRAGAVARADGGVLGFLGGGSSAGAFLGAEGSTLHFREAYEFIEGEGSSIEADHVLFDSRTLTPPGMHIPVLYRATGSTNVTFFPVRFTGEVESLGELVVVGGHVEFDFETPTTVVASGVALNGRITANSNVRLQVQGDFQHFAGGHHPGVLAIERGKAAEEQTWAFLEVAGNILLNGDLQLELQPGFIPLLGAEFTLLRNAGSAPIAGAFRNLLEGATIDLGGNIFAATYLGNDGNDLVLTTVQTVNAPPIAHAGGPYTVGEGGQVLLDASASSDPNAGDELTYAWDFNGDGLFDDAFGVQTLFSAAGLDGNAQRTLGLQVTDRQGASDTTTFELTVFDVPPVLLSLSSDALEVGAAAAGETVELSATFEDPGIQDSFLALIDWGDGTQSEEVVEGRSITAAHTYSTGGIFSITLRLQDANDREAVAGGETFAVVSGARVVDGRLQVIGTADSDSITVDLRNGLLRVTGLPGPTEFSAAEVESIVLFLGAGDDTVVVRQRVTQSLFVDAGEGDDYVVGGAGRNILVGGLGVDRLEGSGEDDLLVGGQLLYSTTAPQDYRAAVETVRKLAAEWNSERDFPTRVRNLRHGDGGNERLNGDAFLIPGETVIDDLMRDLLNGRGGNNWNFAGSDDEIIAAGGGEGFHLGGPEDDIILTGRGHDTIDAGEGNNTINAGAGNNTILVGDGNNVIETRGGQDTITAGDGDNFISAGGGGNTITVGDGRNVIETGSGRDTITTGDGDNQIDAGGGDDHITTGAGNDLIEGGGGDDWIAAGAGDDLVHAGAGNDLVFGGEGNDYLDGGTGADELFGGEGDDLIAWDPRDTRIDGGSGIDTLLGRPGADRIDLTESHITGFEAVLTGEGNDRLTVSVDKLADEGGSALLALLGPGTDRLTIVDGELLAVRGSTVAEALAHLGVDAGSELGRRAGAGPLIALDMLAQDGSWVTVYTEAERVTLGGVEYLVDLEAGRLVER